MAALTFNKCCCCIDLRVGCLILGYLNLFFNTIVTFMTLIGLVAINNINNTPHGPDYQTSAADEKMAKDLEGVIVVLNVITVILLIFLILNLILNIVLLVGIHKNKPGHVRAYVIYNFIFIIISIIMFIVQMANGKGISGPEIVQSLLTIGFSIYILLVFRSYYHKMKERIANGGIFPA